MPAYLECVPVWVRRLRSSLLVGLCLGLLLATVPAPRVHSQSRYTSYVPLFCQPESKRLSLPLFIGEERLEMKVNKHQRQHLIFRQVDKLLQM